MKRISALIAMVALVLSGLVFVAPSASAKVDKRPCVSRAEFRAVHRGMTQTQVKNVFDTWGYQINRWDDYVEDGYWESTYYPDGYYDSYDWDGNGVITPDETEWIDSGFWYDEWVDTSYWLTDTFRTYKKCKAKNFDRGRGRVAINFDNYSSPYSGLRLFSKFRNNPWTAWARTFAEDKAKPKSHTPKNTPAPHAGLKNTRINKTG